MNRLKIIKKLIKENQVFLIILFIGSVIRLMNLIDRPIRHDEFATLEFIKKDFLFLFTSFFFNNEPFTPYYYIFIKILKSLGLPAVYAIRAPSVLFGIWAISAICMLGRTLKLRGYSLYAFVLFYALSPAMVHYSQTGRMYSLFYFLFIYLLNYALIILDSQEPSKEIFVKYFFCSLLTSNVHYYGLILTLISWLYLYIVKMKVRKSLLLIIVGVLICYLPWLYKTLDHIIFSRENQWLSHYYENPLQILTRTAKYFLRGRFTPISLVESVFLFIIPFFVPIYRMFKRSISKNEIFLMTIFYGLAFLILLKGIVGQNAYHPRYYSVLLPIFFYFYLTPIYLFENTRAKNFYVAVLLIFFLIGTYRLGIPYWLYEPI